MTSPAAGSDAGDLVLDVAHYELEFIQPFADDNGRLARLWQSLILSRWNPLLPGCLGLSQRAVEKHLSALQRQGRLLRHGSPRAGYWQVL
ncbi:MAG: hypothetical protein ACK549_02505 [Cyanobacteriota bacterium]|jgi:hypothetical protein